MTLPRTAELPPPPMKTLLIPFLEDEVGRLTREAKQLFDLGDKKGALLLLQERDLVVKSVLIGLRCMLMSPPPRKG